MTLLKTWKKSAAISTDMLDNQALGWVRIIHEDYDIEPMQTRGSYIRDHFDHVVILGTGGSSLGAKAATAIAEILGMQAVTLHVPDSLCPFEMSALLDKLPAEKNPCLPYFKVWYNSRDLVADYCVFRLV